MVRIQVDLPHEVNKYVATQKVVREEKTKAETIIRLIKEKMRGLK